MVLRLIVLINKNSKVYSIKQKKRGRYYSFMPQEIKKIVEQKFNKKYD